MTVLSALLTLNLAVIVSVHAHSTCQNPVHCPCGSTDKNITVCIETKSKENELEFCTKFSRCKSCQDGLTECLLCEDGFEGSLCSIPKRQKLQSRQKRQYLYSRSQQRPGPGAYPVRMYQIPDQRVPKALLYCPSLDSPKLGSIRCTATDQRRTCVGRCLPGYTFENHELKDEITLTCQSGVWTPFNVFPPCKSQGHCDLVVQGPGSFNCTTGMEGTRCDVRCGNRYSGRYFCYPGQSWEPSLPQCVRPKGTTGPSCRCEYGASCDGAGNCVCPVGRTGIFCEIIVPDKATCTDPGFVTNGFRRYMDGSESNSRRSFEQGDSVVYICRSDNFALQGSSLLTCQSDGTWSSPLPKCIQPGVTTGTMCPDPGHVVNADRLNLDGSPALSTQQFRVGQSVAYICHEGFALQLQSPIICLPSGAWSNRTPYCTRIPSQGSVTGTTRPPGSSLRYCRDIGVDPNGSRQPRLPPNRRGFPQGSVLEYSCNEGYDLEGEPSIFCLSSGTWSADRPSCEDSDTNDGPELVYCLNPGSVSNGQVVYYPGIGSRTSRDPQRDNLDPEYPEGSRLYYSCNSGYSLEGRTLLICESSGFWSADKPSCRRDAGTLIYCPNPGPLPNGRVQYIPSLNARTHTRPDDSDMEEAYPQGSRLRYSCNSGYTLEGSETLSCETSGSWSAQLPACIFNSGRASTTMFCDNPGTFFNGRVKVTSSAMKPRTSPERFTGEEVDFPEGTQLEYSCDDGYLLQGFYTLTCRSTGYWSRDPPTCVADCGRSFAQTTRKIVFGEKTAAGEWPWVVAIAVQEGNGSRIVCGGALLNSRTVLTAAHCLVVASKFTLYFGKFHRRDRFDDSGVFISRSSRIIVHPDFSNNTLDSDIGLIMFEPKVKFTDRIQPICLPTRESTAKNLMTGSIGYVTGWGDTEKNLQSDELLLARLPVLTNEACMESYAKQNISLPITRNMFCAGHSNIQQSACSGDSGSPLVFYDNVVGTYTVEGVVSFGVEGQCGVPGRHTIFTKVFQFLPWIFRNMQ